MVLSLNRLRELRSQRIIKNPSVEELREFAGKDELTTEYGSPAYLTRVRNRSAKNTYIVAAGKPLGLSQQPIDDVRAQEIVGEVLDYLKGQELIKVDRNMGCGDNGYRPVPCSLLVTRAYARLAHMWHKSLFEGSSGEPTILSVYVPEWPERAIVVDPEASVTLILGTDYFGEAKKSFLRMMMYLAKKKDCLGVHAGSKVLRVHRKGINGAPLDSVGILLFGLSGTGKTTLTVHDHFLQGEEGVTVRQDDVVIIDPQGHAHGTENSFYIKTEGLDESQRVLYDAARNPGAVLENVAVRQDGHVDFLDYHLTTNGRAIIPRGAVESTDDQVDLAMVNKVFFITRRKDIVGPVARLEPSQAAAFFMLGESIETSAGDPSKAGQSKREVGTNPFIIGPESEEGNTFLGLLKGNPQIECYLLNTGSVGPANIDVSTSATIIREIARETVTWERDPVWEYQVPSEIPGVDLDVFDPLRYLPSSEFQARVKRLKGERIAWLGRYLDLDPSVSGALG